MSFDPHSTDSMFATVLAQLEAQNKLLAEIKQAVDTTNGRVRALETWRQVIHGKVTLISGGISIAVGAFVYIVDLLRSP